MKKLIIKSILMICVFMGISQYFVYIMTGKSPLDGFKTPDLSFGSDDIKNAVTGGKQTVYKWVDENGVTQYTAEPPPEQAVTAVELDPNMNIVKGVEMPEDEKEKSAPKVTLPEGPIYSPKSVKKLMDDAQNVEKLLDDRFKEQEKVLQGI